MNDKLKEILLSNPDISRQVQTKRFYMYEWISLDQYNLLLF